MTAFWGVTIVVCCVMLVALAGVVVHLKKENIRLEEQAQNTEAKIKEFGNAINYFYVETRDSRLRIGAIAECLHIVFRNTEPVPGKLIAIKLIDTAKKEGGSNG